MADEIKVIGQTEHTFAEIVEGVDSIGRQIVHLLSIRDAEILVSELKDMRRELAVTNPAALARGSENITARIFQAECFLTFRKELEKIVTCSCSHRYDVHDESKLTTVNNPTARRGACRADGCNCQIYRRMNLEPEKPLVEL